MVSGKFNFIILYFDTKIFISIESTNAFLEYLNWPNFVCKSSFLFNRSLENYFLFEDLWKLYYSYPTILFCICWWNLWKIPVKEFFFDKVPASLLSIPASLFILLPSFGCVKIRYMETLYKLSCPQWTQIEDASSSHLMSSASYKWRSCMKFRHVFTGLQVSPTKKYDFIVVFALYSIFLAKWYTLT